MYCYIQSEPQLWTVGFYSPDGKWHPDSDHSNREEAAERVAWLNGSSKEQKQPSCLGDVMPSGFTLKQENAIWAVIQYLAKQQFENPKRVYKRKDVFDLIKAEMDW